MVLDEIPLTDDNDRVAESVEQDQTSLTCSLILLYTLRKISLWSSRNIVRSTGYKDFQESVGMFTGRQDITEMTLKKALNTFQSINLMVMKGWIGLIFHQTAKFSDSSKWKDSHQCWN